MKLSSAWMLLVSSMAMVGCMAESLPEDPVGTTDDALVTNNALTQNAITQNALTQNALTQNALTQNALTQNALTQNALSAIEDPSAQGALNRELLQYIVACAFKPSQSFDFTWTDDDGASHAEHLVGQLGLAPKWATGAIGPDGQRMVSACLGAKVNFYGVHVTISVRSGEKPLRLLPFDTELDDYPYVEGAFWGNIWAPTPYLNACYVPTNRDNSRDHLRECASGHVNADGTIAECGIIDIRGSCSSVCKKFDASRGYYEDCLEKPGSNARTDRVITTALP